MDTKNPNVKSRTTPEFAQYQRENFWASNDGVVPPFNTGTSTHGLQITLDGRVLIMVRPGEVRRKGEGETLRRRVVLCLIQHWDVDDPSS